MEVNKAQVIVCKHWVRGSCLLGDRCKHLHRPEDQKLQPQTNPKNQKITAKSRRRHKINNKRKASIFRWWLIKTYGREFLSSGSGILDIAGGKGELAFELCNLNNIKATVIDPRPLKLSKFQKRLLYGFYHTPIQQQLNHLSKPTSLEEIQHPNHFRLFFKPSLWNHLGLQGSTYDIEQLQKDLQTAKSVRWTDRGLIDANVQKRYNRTDKGDAEDEEKHKGKVWEGGEELPIGGWDEVRGFLEDSSIAIGMHPDQATEYIIDFALKMGKPFAVVPCCTYHEEFPHRRLPNGNPVKKYDDLIDYLVSKDSTRIEVQTLDFGGKNKVLFSLPLQKH